MWCRSISHLGSQKPRRGSRCLSSKKWPTHLRVGASMSITQVFTPTQRGRSHNPPSTVRRAPEAPSLRHPSQCPSRRIPGSYCTSIALFFQFTGSYSQTFAHQHLSLARCLPARPTSIDDGFTRRVHAHRLRREMQTLDHSAELASLNCHSKLLTAPGFLFRSTPIERCLPLESWYVLVCFGMPAAHGAQVGHSASFGHVSGSGNWPCQQTASGF